MYHSRKIERASYESLAFRYIAANTHPDHDTIAYFRSRFAAEISALFVPVLLVARVSLNERFAADAPACALTAVEGACCETALTQMQHTLKTTAGRTLYALRKSTVEPAIGVIKHVMGFRQFSVRGLDRVDAEWSLVTLEYNVKWMNVLRMT